MEEAGTRGMLYGVALVCIGIYVFIELHNAIARFREKRRRAARRRG